MRSVPRFPSTTTLVPDQIVAHISASALATATVTAPLTINLTNRGRTWDLNNVVFNDGGRATGYFTYDPATGQYLDVNIQVTRPNPDPDPDNPLGQSPQNHYYYPWPNGCMPTFVNNWSTASEMALQNPVTPDIPVSWTYLQFNFRTARLRTRAGKFPWSSIPLLSTLPTAPKTIGRRARRRGANISQESFALPDNLYNVVPGFFYRIIVSGTVRAQ